MKGRQTLLDFGLLRRSTSSIHGLVDFGLLRRSTSSIHGLVDFGLLRRSTSSIHGLVDFGLLRRSTSSIHGLVDFGLLRRSTSSIHGLVDFGLLRRSIACIPAGVLRPTSCILAVVHGLHFRHPWRSRHAMRVKPRCCKGSVSAQDKHTLYGIARLSWRSRVRARLSLRFTPTIATAMLGAPARRPDARVLREQPGSFMKYAG